MAAEARRPGRSWTVDDIFEHRYTVIGLLVVLIISLLVILWLLFSMSRYEREGDEFFGKTKYEQALERYVKALQHQAFSGKDRLLFKMAQTLAAADDPVRAMDFVVEIVTAYPDDNYYRGKAEALARTLHDEINRDPVGMGVGQPPAELGTAREQFRKLYAQLLTVLKSGPGDEADRRRTKRYYEQYKASYENYQKLLSTGYREAVQQRQAEQQKRSEERSVEGRPAPASSSEE